MSRIVTLMKQFSRDESGAALVEYAVIFAVLIAGTVTAFGLISDELERVFQLVVDIMAAII